MEPEWKYEKDLLAKRLRQSHGQEFHSILLRNIYELARDYEALAPGAAPAAIRAVPNLMWPDEPEALEAWRDLIRQEMLKMLGWFVVWFHSCPVGHRLCATYFSLSVVKVRPCKVGYHSGKDPVGQTMHSEVLC